MNGGNDMNYNNNSFENNNNANNSGTQDEPMGNNTTNTNNTNNNNQDPIEQRPIFLGNLSTMCNIKDIEDMFERPILSHSIPHLVGPIEIERIDLKRGFGFVFLKNARSLDERDAVEKYVQDLNGMEVANVSKQLRSELARGDGRIKRKEDVRRQNITPNETLFVVNFHEETTRKEDLEMLFSPYGDLIRIDMKKNYAFVQFATVDQAKRAKDATNGGKLDQSVITVEYVARRDRDNGHHDSHGSRRDYNNRDSYRSSRSSPDRYNRRDRSPSNRYRDDRSPPRRGRSPDSRFRDRDSYNSRRSRYGSPDNNRSSRYHYRHSSPPSRRDRDARSSPDNASNRDNYRRRNTSRSRSRSPFNHRRGGSSKFRSSPPRGGARDSYRNSRYDDRRDNNYHGDTDRRERNDRTAGFRSDDRGYGGARDNDNNL